MKHELPSLPYALDALSPYISEETLNFHYGKHHKAYVDNLNKLIVDTEFADKTLEEIIKTAPRGGIFNNAAQIWNHTFYFLSLAPAHSSQIPNEIMDFISQKWENLEQFQEEFNKNALANFGSGWTWLVKNSE